MKGPTRDYGHAVLRRTTLYLTVPLSTLSIDCFSSRCLLQDLVDRIQNTLTLTRRIKPPVEEVFVESSEEDSEAEEEEEEDKDFPPLSDEVSWDFPQERDREEHFFKLLPGFRHP